MKKIVAYFIGDKIYSNSKEAFDLNESQMVGEKSEGKIFYMLEEALHLINTNKIILKDHNLKEISEETFIKKSSKISKNFFSRYLVYENLSKKGYKIKTGFKFGADFRIYEKGKKKEKHSKWICFCVNEKEKFSWTEFSSKNRVANSTRKKLLIAMIDQENKITYYEISWKRDP